MTSAPSHFYSTVATRCQPGCLPWRANSPGNVSKNRAGSERPAVQGNSPSRQLFGSTNTELPAIAAGRLAGGSPAAAAREPREADAQEEAEPEVYDVRSWSDFLNSDDLRNLVKSVAAEVDQTAHKPAERHLPATNRVAVGAQPAAGPPIVGYPGTCGMPNGGLSRAPPPFAMPSSFFQSNGCASSLTQPVGLDAKLAELKVPKLDFVSSMEAPRCPVGLLQQQPAVHVAQATPIAFTSAQLRSITPPGNSAGVRQQRVPMPSLPVAHSDSPVVDCRPLLARGGAPASSSNQPTAGAFCAVPTPSRSRVCSPVVNLQSSAALTHSPAAQYREIRSPSVQCREIRSPAVQYRTITPATSASPQRAGPLAARGPMVTAQVVQMPSRYSPSPIRQQVIHSSAASPRGIPTGRIDAPLVGQRATPRQTAGPGIGLAPRAAASPGPSQSPRRPPPASPMMGTRFVSPQRYACNSPLRANAGVPAQNCPPRSPVLGTRVVSPQRLAPTSPTLSSRAVSPLRHDHVSPQSSLRAVSPLGRPTALAQPSAAKLPRALPIWQGSQQQSRLLWQVPVPKEVVRMHELAAEFTPAVKAAWKSKQAEYENHSRSSTTPGAEVDTSSDEEDCSR